MLFASRSSVSVRERIPLAAVAISESIEAPRLDGHASCGPLLFASKEGGMCTQILASSCQESGVRHHLVAMRER
jgi:hypothetical protein